MEAMSDHGTKWMDEIYWNHFRQARFLHRLPSGFRHQLALPRKFAEKLKKILPETVVLKGPGGDSWEVKLVAKNDTLFFRDGWDQFVNDHSLQEKDLLLFIYNFGDSQFDVLMFDSESNCEKEASYFVKLSGEGAGEAEMGEKRRQRTQWEEDIYWTHFRTMHFLQHLSIDCLRQLALPGKFAHKLKSNLPEIATLKGPSGSVWNVALSGYDSLSFNCGWQEFVKDHCLEKDDLLIFQYHVDSCFEVLAFDPSSMCEKEATYFSKRCEEGEDLCVHPDQRKMQEKFPEDCQDTGCNLSSEAHSGECAIESTKKKMRREARIEPPSHPAGKLKGSLGAKPSTAKERRTALQSANAAATWNSFVVVMQPSFVYTTFQMGVPSSWLRLHLSKEITELVLRVGEMLWITKLYRRRDCGGQLTKGWKDFVLDNDLEKDDVCLFKPVAGTKENPVVLDVSIFRAADKILLS